MRVAVIGAGVVGLACAGWLRMRGHAITLVDPGEPGESCSAGNAGLFSLSSFVPLGLPGAWRQAPGWLADPLGPLAIRPAYLPRLVPWLLRFHRSTTLARVEASADAMHALLSRTWQAWLPLAEWAGASALIRRDGWAAAYRSQAALDGDALGWRLRRERGVRMAVLADGEVRDFDPALSPSVTRLVHLPEQGHCTDPLALSRALAGRLSGDGAVRVRSAARGFDFRDGRVVAVRTDGETVPTDAVVVAAGAFSAPLAAQLGSPVPLDTERGYHATLSTPGARPRIPVLDAERKWFATPMRAGLRLAGTVEFAGVSAVPDWRRADALLAQVDGLLPGALARREASTVGRPGAARDTGALPPDTLPADAAGVSRWMGRRPSLPDSRPVIGRAPAIPNAVLAFGHAHVGLTSAAITGRLVAELLAGEPALIDLRPFAAERFA